jgi:general secretion pathway protein D
MKPLGLSIKTFGILTVLLLVVAAPFQAARAQNPAGQPAAERFVTIDFNNVDINVFIKFISELTGRNFIVDQRVKGNVTIISPTKISIDEAYRVFESVLEVHGFTAVKAGRVTKILPAPDARTKNIETLLRAEGAAPEDKLVTQLVPLTYADPEELKRLFTPLVSRNSVIVAYDPSNMLIITDVFSNIQRLMRIVKEIDVPGVGREISMVPLNHADSTKMVSILNSVFQAAPQGRKPDASRIAKFVADERTNSLIVLASEVDTQRIKQLVALLDTETPRGKEKVRVYYLEYADAEELAKVLQELPSAEGAQGKGKEAPALVSGRTKITADKATNSLVIMAESDDYQVLEEIMRQLDTPRPMVYIEALIMEVDVQKTFNFGTEWTAAGKIDVGGNPGGVGGGFRLPSGQSALPGLSAGILPSGFSMGVFTEAIEIGGVTFNNLRALIRAVREDRDINVLSTPQILTTENQEAKINVGKNIPFQTTTSTSGNDTYNSFEYRDVGTILTITPHISQERLVRLNIGFEFSVLESTTDFKPTTLKRTVDTTVIVSDGNTVVIGGLIDEIQSVSEFKVPLLGDIPGLGWLFKFKDESNEKTNLFVFLTPHVINNATEAEKLYDEKRGRISDLREGRIKLFDGAPADDSSRTDRTPE